MTNDLRSHWGLEPEIRFLNHGSFGACPRAVLAVQSELRARMERQPVAFFLRDLEALLDAARAKVAAFVGAPADDLAFVANATAGVSTVLRSLDFAPGDELLTTSHVYNACANALRLAAERRGARVVVAEVPFPIASPELVTRALLAAATPKTRLVLIDHVTSPTGLVFPVREIVAAFAERGVDVLIDGAHAPGMIDLRIAEIGAAYYTANCHKWMCAPKGAAILYVRPDRQDRIHPLAISHGTNSRRTDRSRFRLEHDWQGTDDPTAWLCVPESIQYMEKLVDGGWPAIRARNRALALAGRDLVVKALGIPAPVPDAMLGSMAAIPLPAGRTEAPASAKQAFSDETGRRLWEQHRIELPVFTWPAPGRRVLRFSAQLYNRIDEYEALARELPGLV
jgi:isopenicillin-N epimerase